MSTDWVAEPGERLVTEWDRDVPSDDTLVRAYVDAFAEMVEAIARAAGGRVHRDDTVLLGDAAAPGAYLNGAVLLAPLAEASASEIVARAHGFFGGEPGGPWILFSATPTPDLRPYGLEPVGHPPLMLRPAGGTRRPPPDDLEVVAVGDSETLRVFERTVIDAYPMPEMRDSPAGVLMPDAVLDDDSLRLYLGLVDGEPVGTS
ncbi:MAG TPA: N-acetyltransferase, partial [Acidimicrobiia bacterium]|nr:N-acetyltransferase [Acidimicrobiia bacterium]